uniref:Uncharacterized protein n=1 Tax=Arundo donax TaxID=35708 RepID=A0A0A9HG72_ARUDO
MKTMAHQKDGRLKSKEHGILVTPTSWPTNRKQETNQTMQNQE